MNQIICLLCVKYQNISRTNLKARSILEHGAKVWNELDSKLRKTKPILLFINKFKWGVLPTYISQYCESSHWKISFDVEYSGHVT